MVSLSILQYILLLKALQISEIMYKMIYSHWYLFKWYTYMYSALLIKSSLMEGRKYLKPQMQIEDRTVHFCSYYIDIRGELEKLNAT